MAQPPDQQIKALVNDVLREFLIPGKIDNRLRLAQEEVQLHKFFTKDIYVALLSSLVGISDALSMPFYLIADRVHSINFQRFRIAEAIRALDLDDEIRDKVACEKASEKFETWRLGGGDDIIRNEIISIIHDEISVPRSVVGARELIKQGVVMAWSAFEVFCRDILENAINKDNSIFLRLATNGNIKQKYLSNSIDWILLAQYDYNMSGKLGTFMVQKVDMSDIITIKKFFRAIFPNSAHLAEALNNKRLWELNQKRNLIVHRRGIVDQKYINQTGEEYSIGEKLKITPADVEKFQEAILDVSGVILNDIKRLQN